MQRRDVKKPSLNLQFDEFRRANGVKRELYHSGKFDGVNCIRIIWNSTAIILGSPNTPGSLHLVSRAR
jgi:hypothetical protein